MENSSEIIDVDISEFKVASGDCILRTSGIGSCIVITLYDPVKKIGGLAHAMLTGSGKSSPKYVSSAIKFMVKKMEFEGADIRRLKAKIVGGADVLEEENSREIGIQNIETAIRKLKEKNIKVVAKDVGKNYSRSVEFNLATGVVLVTPVGENGKVIR